MKLLSAEYWRRAVRARAGTDMRGVLWPASFPHAPRARVTAHALAALVIVTAVCGAYIIFYWADDPQVTGRYRVDALSRGACTMAIPVLSMCVALSRAARGRFGALYWLLSALAWVTATTAVPLLVAGTAVTNDNDYCTALPPEHPPAGHVLPASLLAALFAGSASASIVWAVSHGRIRPTALYTAWLVTVAVVVVASLAPQLHSAQTCGPKSGAAAIPSGSAREYSW